jgi:hypothetical protein
MKVILKPNGILEKIDYSEKTADVTDIAFRYLYYPVELQNVTLRDLFLLINKHLDIFELIFGNWIVEYTEDALNKTPEKPSGLEYLEYEWYLENADGELDVPSFPRFGGRGIADEDDEHVHYKKGDLIKYGIDFIAVENLVDLPLKLSENLEILSTNRKRNSGYKIDNYRTSSYTLGDVIQGMIWEISFSGGPEEKIEARKKLEDALQEINYDELKSLP